MPRDFIDYEDSEAAYHRRPSAAVLPRGDWGAGAVMLVEIPTADEFLDNIVAFWRPAEPLAAGGTYDFDYDILWTADPPAMGTLFPVVQSRSGLVHDGPGLRYVVDFPPGAADAGLRPDLSVQSDGAETTGLTAFRVTETGRLRVSFVLLEGPAAVAEVRLVLRDDTGAARSPVWLHRWTRSRDGGR